MAGEDARRTRMAPACRTVRWPALALVVLCGLGGCTTGRDYRRPEIAAAAQWRSGPAGAGSLADLGWWEVFGDPVLQELIRAALGENKDLRLAVARVAEARAQLGVTRANQVGRRGRQLRHRRTRVGLLST